MENMAVRADALRAAHTPPLTHSMRFSSLSRSALCAGVIGAGLALPATVLAQGRSGRRGQDDRPEVTFPVTLPQDDARVAKLKKDVQQMIDSMSTFTQQMVD